MGAYTEYLVSNGQMQLEVHIYGESGAQYAPQMRVSIECTHYVAIS